MKIALLFTLVLIIPIAFASPLEDDLRATYGKEGITASTGHFNDVWARDSMFAAWGSLVLNDTEIVNVTLHTLLNAQRNGQIPLKVAHGIQPLKFIGIKTAWPRIVYYRNDKSSSKVVDSNCLFLITLEKYVSETHDYSLLENWTLIDSVYSWQLSQDTDNNSLIEQGTYADWADSLKREGETLYANACFAGSSIAMTKMARYSGQDDLKYIFNHKLTAEALQEFWNGDYYDEMQGNGVLDTAGNLLMIYFNLTNHSTEILSAIADASPNAALPVTMTPKHAFSEKSSLLYFAGMGDYHEKQRWSWIAALQLLVEKQYDYDAYKANSAWWKQKIDKDNGVYEVYEPDGSPVKRFFYKSEKPFAWGSGMMILVIDENLKV
ncbi:MAG: GH116 family glycosyl hydrolase [Candidatus Woesearchaeota archaeon]